MKDIEPSHFDLIEEMDSLNGYEIIQEIESLEATYYVFKQNFKDLIEKIKEYESDIKIWYVKNRHLLHQTQIEILRLLHNYVSSVLTLIDHTRNFRKKIEEKNLEKAFEIEINNLNINDVVHFTKQLRQYFQHYRLPITNAQFSVEKLNGSREQRSPKMRILLDIDELLKWKKWNGASKRYLEKFDDNIEIKDFCQEYYKVIEQFYEIFHYIVLQAYNTEIKDLAIFEERINNLYPPPSKID